MNIFADFHHSGLFTSLKLLLEDRLGHRLYRPIGLEWFNEGYWEIAAPYGNNIGTVKQFLTAGSTPTDGTPPLNNVLYDCITLDEFKEMKIDIIIASIPDHIRAYTQLIKDHKPEAKLIYHMGNIGWHTIVPWNQVNNIMASVAPFPIREGKNAVFYRQEFDLNVFKPTDRIPSNHITSFVNLLPQPEKFEKLKKLLPEYQFFAYGSQCPDGIVETTKRIAIDMQLAKFGYHNKPLGDGFGHVIHNWFAVGKPVIVNLSDYKDKLAGELLEDGVTCVDLDRGIEYVASRVKNMSDLEYWDMCKNVKERFASVVDFQRDAKNVKDFIERLI